MMTLKEIKGVVASDKQRPSRHTWHTDRRAKCSHERNEILFVQQGRG